MDIKLYGTIHLCVYHEVLNLVKRLNACGIDISHITFPLIATIHRDMKFLSPNHQIKPTSESPGESKSNL